MWKSLLFTSLIAATFNFSPAWSADLPNGCGKSNGATWSSSMDGYRFNGTVKKQGNNTPGITASKYGKSRDIMKDIFLESRIAQQLDLSKTSPDKTLVNVQEVTMGTSKKDTTPSGIRTDADLAKNSTQTRYQMQKNGVTPSPTYASVFVPHSIQTIPLSVLSEAFRLSAAYCSVVEVELDSKHNSKVDNADQMVE